MGRPHEDLVEPLHVILELQAQERLLAMIHDRSVGNIGVLRVLSIGLAQLIDLLHHLIQARHIHLHLGLLLFQFSLRTESDEQILK